MLIVHFFHVLVSFSILTDTPGKQMERMKVEIQRLKMDKAELLRQNTVINNIFSDIVIKNFLCQNREPSDTNNVEQGTI